MHAHVRVVTSHVYKGTYIHVQYNVYATQTREIYMSPTHIGMCKLMGRRGHFVMIGTSFWLYRPKVNGLRHNRGTSVPWVVWSSHPCLYGNPVLVSSHVGDKHVGVITHLLVSSLRVSLHVNIILVFLC